MSRIYFHSEDGEAEVRGAERAMMGNLCNDWLVDGLRVNQFASEEWLAALAALLPGAQPMYQRDVWADTLRIRYHLAHEDITLDGQQVGLFAIALNTALVLGSDPVKLCARLHGQCEMHCYVEGPNRAWLADIIEQGQAIRLLRDDMGWEGVITLLRSRDDGPVVCSYSVTEGFPNAGIVIDAGLWPWTVGAGTTPDYDAWYTLDGAEQWRLGVAALRQQNEHAPQELTPDTWGDFHFHNGWTALDVVERLAAILKDTTP